MSPIISLKGVSDNATKFRNVTAFTCVYPHKDFLPSLQDTVIMSKLEIHTLRPCGPRYLDDGPPQ